MTKLSHAAICFVFSTCASLVCAQQGTLLVANQLEHTLVTVDPVSGRPTASIAVGVNDHEVTASPDGKLAYVPIYSNVGLGAEGTNGRTVDVIDLEKKALAYSIDLGKPVRPHRAQFGSDGLLYVSAELDNSIYIIDPNTRKVVGSIPTGEPQSHMFILRGDRAYTANVNTGTVSVLDVKNRKLLTVIPVAKDVQRISLTPDGSLAFTHASDNRVIVIDTAKKAVKVEIPTPGMPYASAVTKDGKWLIVVMPKNPQAVIVDLSTFKIARTIAVPAGVTEVLTEVPGNKAYLSSYLAGQVVELNLDTWKITRTFQLTKGVDGIGWAGSLH